MPDVIPLLVTRDRGEFETEQRILNDSMNPLYLSSLHAKAPNPDPV